MFNKQKEEQHNIWMSFSDLYSGLMVIFIVVSLALVSNYKADADKSKTDADKYKTDADEHRIDADKYKKLKAIQGMLSELKKSGLFEYNEKCKRFEYKQDIKFPYNSDSIPVGSRRDLVRAGKEILNIVQKMDKSGGCKIQIVVEGRASNGAGSSSKIGAHPDQEDLSYHRAISLVRLWEGNDINLQTTTSELYIAGSGYGGQCRYSGDEEAKNRRFIIQIIPYIPNLK